MARAGLLGAVAPLALVLASGPALAQEAGGGMVDADEIIVVGSRPIAESEEAALKIQRESLSLASVVASDAIGRLPDQNIAQAISRLPGIAVQRDQGQARYVSIRGAPVNWTTIAFDGINVVAPEGRATRFDSIPSAIAAQVVVEKAVQPWMTGETIAGNVNVVTRSAFDYSRFHVAAKGGVGYVDLGGGREIEGSLVLANRFKLGGGELGVLVSGSYYERNMATDNFEIDWEVVDQDRRPGFEDRVWAREIENKFYRLKRRNWSATGKLEWIPQEGQRLFFSSIYTIFMDDERRDNYRLDTDDQQGRVPNSPLPCPGINPAPPPFTTGYADVCTGNDPFKGTVYGIDFDARFRETAYRQSIFTNTIGGDHSAGEWLLKWRGNYTQSKDDRSQPYLLTYQQPGFGTNGVGAVNRTTTDYDLTDRFNSQVRLFRTLRSPTGVLSRGEPVDRYDQLPNSLNALASLDAVDTTNAWTGRLEALRDTGFLGGNTQLRFGLQFDRRTKEVDENQLTRNAAQLTALGIPAPLTALLDGGADYKGKLSPGYSFNHFNEATARDWLARAQGVATYDPVLANYYRVTEEIWSGWAMATTRLDWGSIVYGVRVENITNSGEAFSTIGGTQTLVRADSSFTQVLPSVHVNWDVTDVHRIRVGFTTGAARPDYSDLRPSFTVNDANEQISGGNPFATPEKAWGLDAYWEAYLLPRGFASVGVFWKRVTDVLFEDTTVFGSDILDTPGVDRSDYLLTTLVNGGKGSIAGVEAALQVQLGSFMGDDTWWGGFGLQANATMTTSKAETPDGFTTRLPNTSDLIYNIGPYYEKYGFSAKLSYQKRTAWLSELGGPDTGGDIYWDDDAELDFSMRYALTRNLELYFDAANILNGPGRRYAGSPARTLEWETFGRRFTGGFRGTW